MNNENIAQTDGLQPTMGKFKTALENARSGYKEEGSDYLLNKARFIGGSVIALGGIVTAAYGGIDWAISGNYNNTQDLIALGLVTTVFGFVPFIKGVISEEYRKGDKTSKNKYN